jgi:type IV secretory pathway TrbF-like protein
MEQYEDQFLRVVVRWLFWLGIGAVGAIVTLTGALIALALRPPVPPYVVALDNGRIVGYAHVFAGNQDIAPEVIEDQVKQFIYDARMISNNRAFEEHSLHVAYAMARGQAERALEDYYTRQAGHDPIALGHEGNWRDVKIIRCLHEPEASDTYRVEWQETFHPQTGDPTTSNWEATLKVVVAKPQPDNELNPIGVYITNLDMKAAA